MHSIKTFAVVLGVGLGAIGTVFAQDSTESGSAAPASDKPAKTGSPEQMLSQAKSAMATIDSVAAVISRMLRDARNDKDVVKVLCLDDKLNQIDVAKRSVGERVSAMELAVASGSTERLEFELAVIGALEERANGLSAEAHQCIGEEKGIVGGSRLEVKIDPNIPSQDTSTTPTSPMVSTPPVSASATF